MLPSSASDFTGSLPSNGRVIGAPSPERRAFPACSLAALYASMAVSMLLSGTRLSEIFSFVQGDVIGNPRVLQLAIQASIACLLYVCPSSALTGSSKMDAVMGQTMVHLATEAARTMPARSMTGNLTTWSTSSRVKKELRNSRERASHLEFVIGEKNV